MAIKAQTLKNLRRRIDSEDKAILKALSRRFKSVQKIGTLKAAAQLPIRQPKRWNELKANRQKLAKKLGLSSLFIEQLLQAIHNESIRIQRKLCCE